MESTQCLWLPLLLTTTIGLLLLVPSTTSSIHTIDDRHTLLSFKSLITDDPSGALSSWSSNSSSNGSFCGWTGVTCSSSHLDPRRITMLRLPGLSLSGTVSPLLGNLSRLRVLDLSDNMLQGEIPSSLGNCFALRRLNMSVNSLSGVIPPAIGNLSNLVILNIRANNLSGTIPPSFANLAKLTFLAIEDNFLHGNIPPWLGNLTMLIHLNMGFNMFSGHLPPALSKLIYLQFLAVGINKLDGVIPPALCNISSLELLNFGSNQLSGSLPQDMGSTLPNLRSLSVFYNQLEGHIPASLSNISVLESIVLHGNRFQGPIPPNTGHHGRLRVFEVGNNELQSPGPRDWDFLTSLTNCSNFVVLNLQLNNLSGILPSSIANLTLKLEKLMMGGNQIVGHIPTTIGRYYKLTKLEFAENFFTGTIPSGIGKLSNLHNLILSNNRLHGPIPLSLGNMSRLNQLLLSSNNLEGSIPTTLGNLSELTSLDLSSNHLSGQIPQEVLSISSLSEYINISSNLLVGPVSPHVGLLVNLGTIDLSLNQLSGAIPATIGSCLELQFLYLQGNFFDGKIPKELDTLRGLEKLDLSNNKLLGPVPEFLEGLQFLKHLNLSFNNLSGPLPAKGIFSNKSSVSLQHNGMLCGGPAFFHFPSCPFLAPDKPPKHKLLHVLVFPIVAGAFILLCIATCYCVNKSRGDARQGQENRISPGEMFQRMSYAELLVATDSFSMENLVGHGSFGSVYKGTFSSGTAAVKVLDVQRRGATRSFISECSALKRIRHRNLVKVITVCDSLDNNGNEFKALVLEFISNGSLDEWIYPSRDNEFRTLSLMQRLNIAVDVAGALDYLHHHIVPPIVHCDVKPSNILLDASMVAHVSDFGIAKIMKAEENEQSIGEQHSSSSVGIKGTIGYLAPEYGMGTEISIEGDVYSFGVLLLELLTGRRPTDTLFDDSTSLPKYVEMAGPGNLWKIMDANIPRCENPQEMVELLITPVSKLGLACCRESARKRVKMGDVVKELGAIKRSCESKSTRSQRTSHTGP